MELYLLRHGTSVANERQLVCGASDYPLSDKGIEQAKKVSKYLSDISFSHIYTSPLSRAINTIAGMKKGVIPRVEDRLKELNTGDVSDITLPELWAHDPRFRKPWLSPDMHYPNGESFREMITRIVTWFVEHVSVWTDNDRVLIVGHEGTLRSIYLYLMNLDIADYPDFPIGNCDHLYFKLNQGKALFHSHVKLIDHEGVAN
jgi:broad specificity phosphatase PhoE